MLGTTELILILIVILLLFIAPRQITSIARSLGDGIRAFREETKGMSIEPSEQPLLVFVSSKIDELSDERHAIRQAIQQIPLTKPWLFEFTPPSSEKVDDSYLEKVKEGDIFILIVGNSISEPVINEFELAIKVHKPCLVFIKDCDRTESAQSFVDNIPFKWVKFSTTEELLYLVQLGLVDELIRGYREGWQKKLSPDHLVMLVSIQELLRIKKPEAELLRKPDTIYDTASSLSRKDQHVNAITLKSEGNKHFDQRDFQSEPPPIKRTPR